MLGAATQQCLCQGTHEWRHALRTLDCREAPHPAQCPFGSRRRPAQFSLCSPQAMASSMAARRPCLSPAP
eukprot:1139334-Pelagomonas_calceolata.AAC.23